MKITLKIAITGGTGFLGKYVIEKLKKRGSVPIVLTRNKNNNRKSSYEHRVTDYSKIDLLDKLSDIDAVVHLAAKRSSCQVISEFHSNETLTQNLYDACYELNITNIVYASTISVYSDERLLPWTETQYPEPISMYGISKLTCEHIGNIYSAKKSLYVKNLRFAHLYGFNEKNNYMINLFFRRAFNHKELVLDSRSIARREFLYVKDAAKAIELAVNQPLLKGTFNIGSGEALTNYDVAQTINKIFKNSDNLFIKNSSSEEQIQSSYMETCKAREILKFSPDYTFVEAVSEIYALMKELEYVPILY